MASSRETVHMQAQAQAITNKIKTLLNSDLKEICRGEGLAVSGIKNTLQGRITNLVEHYLQNGNAARLDILHYRVHNHGAAPPPSYNAAGPDVIEFASPSYTSHSSPAASNSYKTMTNGHGISSSPLPPPPPLLGSYAGARTVRYQFKNSPFYDVLEPLADVLDLQVLSHAATPNHRNSAQLPLKLTPATSDRLKEDPSLRIMLFSALDQPLGPYTRFDVAFPQQIEVKVNGDEVRANFKGLKNKPGSTRPADITDFVRKVPNYQNNIQITYALTTKVNSNISSKPEKFHVVVNLVRKHTVEELTARIKKGRYISKELVINDMVRKADDPDIVATSTVMSLKDPVSTLRISVPCRSTICTHNQCFDAESFLQLQEQAPTWVCPVCNKTVAFEGLVVDQYVQEILQATPKSTEQVTIEPNGKWSQGVSADESTQRNGAGKGGAEDYSDDSDDLIEITDQRVKNLKQEASNTPTSLARTPPLSSREPSTVGSAGPKTGNKRTSEYIDLTLSDDEEPPRPAKKPAYHNGTSSSAVGSANALERQAPFRPIAAPRRNLVAFSIPQQNQPQVHQNLPQRSLPPPHGAPALPAPPGYPGSVEYGGHGSPT